MKNRLLLILFCLAFAAIYAFCWLTAPRHRITEENFARIKEGMTEKEVESILGVPAGNYETKKRMPLPAHDLFVPTVPCETKVWEGNGLVITIWFDAEGKVFHSRIGGWSSEEPTFLDMLRRLLGM
jgi:hypothetical protein